MLPLILGSSRAPRRFLRRPAEASASPRRPGLGGHACCVDDAGTTGVAELEEVFVELPRLDLRLGAKLCFSTSAHVWYRLKRCPAPTRRAYKRMSVRWTASCKGSER